MPLNTELTKEQRASIREHQKAARAATHIVVWVDRNGNEHPRGKAVSKSAATRATKVLNGQRAASSFGHYAVAEI